MRQSDNNTPDRSADLRQRDRSGRGLLLIRAASFGHALAGIGNVLANEPHARLHLAATIVVVIGAALLQVSAVDWALLIVACALVWISEIVNSAIELMCDVVSPEFNKDIGRVKDMAAGAVLMAAFAASFIGLIVLMRQF